MINDESPRFPNEKDYVTKELEELYEEQLIKDYRIISSMENEFTFIIFTLEDNFLEISIDKNNCYKVRNDEMLYENFEQLLNKHSKAYSTRFGKILFEKLNRFVERNEDEDN